jgi:hypothetical protein
LLLCLCIILIPVQINHSHVLMALINHISVSTSLP